MMLIFVEVGDDDLMMMVMMVVVDVESFLGIRQGYQSQQGTLLV